MRTRCAESLVARRQPPKDWWSCSGCCSSRSWSGVRQATPLRRRRVEGAPPARTRGQLGAQPRPPCQADHLQCRAKGCARVRSVYIWSCRTLLGDRLPLALHVDPSTRVRVDTKLRGRAAAHEHPLARLKGTTVACASVLPPEAFVPGVECHSVPRQPAARATTQNCDFSTDWFRCNTPAGKIGQKSGGAISGSTTEGLCFQGLSSSGGGIWTHFPGRVTYRFTEVRRLEPT
jgi:hypothetical protein